MFCEIEGITYHVQRKGAGKPLVCLHGFAETQSTWHSLHLAGRQLILVDLIGHGESDKPYSRRYYRVPVMLTHLNKLLNQLAVRNYSLLGYSMGGRIALAYALAYARELESLILESASYGERGWLNRFKRRQSDAELAGNIREKGVGWFDEYWSGLSIFASQRKLPATVSQAIKARRLGNAPHALANTLLGSGQGTFPCLKDHISGLTMPVLYISGEYDEKYSAIGQEFNKLNPNIRHEIINGAGHNTHLEDGSAFSAVVTTFLSCTAITASGC